MFYVKISLAFIALFSFASSTELPADIKKCKRSSDNQVFSKCVLDAITAILPKLAKGLPEFGIESCQPLKINNYTVGEGKGIVHVVQNYKNAGLYNFVTMKLKKVDASFTDKELNIKMEAFSDHLIMKADYNLNGRILVLPVYGNGKTTVDLFKVKIIITIKGTTYKKQGETYINFKDFKIELDPKKLMYNFENLFDGNKVLGDDMNKILNENDLDVYRDVRKGYDQVTSDVCKTIANTFVSKIPLNSMFLP